MNYPTHNQLSALSYIYNYTGIVTDDLTKDSVTKFISEHIEYAKEMERDIGLIPTENWKRYYDIPTISQMKYIKYLQTETGVKFVGSTKSDAIEYIARMRNRVAPKSDNTSITPGQYSIIDRIYEVTQIEFNGSTRSDAIRFINAYLPMTRRVSKITSKRSSSKSLDPPKIPELTLTDSQILLISKIRERTGEIFCGKTRKDASEFIASNLDKLRSSSRDKMDTRATRVIRTEDKYYEDGSRYSSNLLPMSKSQCTRTIATSDSPVGVYSSEEVDMSSFELECMLDNAIFISSLTN